MKRLLVETVASHSCTGCSSALPEVVRCFCEDTGVPVEFRFYRVWDISAESPSKEVPEYVREHVERLRRGEADAAGFFLNGRWFPLAAHHTDHMVQARQALAQAAGVKEEEEQLRLTGRSIRQMAFDGSRSDSVALSNSKVGEWGAFSTDFENIWFFEGSIKKLSLDSCPVAEFHYRGSEINKLVDMANRHPELFGNREGGEDCRAEPVAKTSLDEVSVRLLTEEDLDKGRHPCVINGGVLDPESIVHRQAAQRFGGWGYEAVWRSQTCGFLGVLPKDISCRDGGFLPPGEEPMDRVLLLTCYAGGGVFGPQFDRIGIATKMIRQAVADAGAKGYRRVEAYAHPEVEHTLQSCGFTCVEWENGLDAPQKYYMLEIVNI